MSKPKMLRKNLKDQVREELNQQEEKRKKLNENIFHALRHKVSNGTAAGDSAQEFLGT